MATPTEQSVKKDFQPSVETVVQPNEDVQASFASLHQKNRAVIQPPDEPQRSTLSLPPPTFLSTKTNPVAEKEAPLQHKQPFKNLTEWPQLPLFEDEGEEYGVAVRKDASKAFDCGFDLKAEVSPPATKYSEGEIKYATKEALNQMVKDLPRLNPAEKTGCIIDATCDPECNDYIEGIHFLSKDHIGSGSSGKVDLCYDSKTWKPFIRKELPKAILRTSEVIVPMTLNHRNFTKFYGLIQRECNKEENPTMELLIEYAGFALNKYIYMLQGKHLTHEQIWDLSKQGLEALAHISHYSIVHLDVKPENICVAPSNGTLLLKLTDFGSSKLPQEPLKFMGLTPEYMAPEMCKLILQAQGIGLDWGLTEADITGKVDTFAFGLVIMYMYKGYHILVKVITKGKTTYEGLDIQTKRLLHMLLMTLMADDRSGDSFVQNLIPDECYLDMRALLRRLTEHKHQDRFSARQGLDFINVEEQKKNKTCIKQEQNRIGIVEDCMENGNGPVKNRTKDALHMKLQPYSKSGKKGKYSTNLISIRTTVSEMSKLIQGEASKQIIIPPVNEFKRLSLEQRLPKQLFEDNSDSCTSELIQRWLKQKKGAGNLPNLSALTCIELYL